MRWIFLLIDYEYRATSTIFVHDMCGSLVHLKESAWHKHRLSADLENKSDLARQRYSSLPSVAFQKQSVIWKYLVCLASVQGAFAMQGQEWVSVLILSYIDGFALFLAFEPLAQNQVYSRKEYLQTAYATGSEPSPCLGHLVHSCMPIGTCVFHISISWWP